ncbi:MAG: Hsp20/alpha crystallin family protein [Verrucomicrobiia bacterium]
MRSGEFDKFRERFQRIKFEMKQNCFYAYSDALVWEPPLNLLKGDDRLVICMDIPGVEKNNIRIKAEERRVLVSGFRKFPEPKEGAPVDGWNVLAMEIDSGTFGRIIELPEKINPEAVKAEYRDGVLWITMPLAGIENQK